MELFYDLGSPYAWLTAERIEGATWVPVLLGGIFRATGRASWAGTEAREPGMAEIERRARERGLSELRLDTRSDLVEARRLYERLGYREIEPFGDNPYAGHWFAKRL